MLKRKIYSISIIFLLLKAMFLSSADAATYTYDSLLRITKADYGNGFTEEYTYDTAGNRLMITVTSISISGAGYNYPEEGFRASLSLEIKASSLETGRLQYYYTKSRINLSSTSITGLLINGSTAGIKGGCTVNGLEGYSFRATISDRDTDTMAIEVYDPDGTVYFSAQSEALNSGDFSLETDPRDQYQLATSTVPSGGGTVSPDCSDGCLYESGTLLIITASENSGYGFIEWSGCDSTANNVCNVTMDEDKNAAALFGSCNYPVRIAGVSPVYYSSIQDAYSASQDNDIIQMQDAVFPGNIYIDRDISIILQGGFDCSYNNNTGITTLDGSMTISSGTVMIENIVLE